MIEIKLLRALASKENFDDYRNQINQKTLSTESITILKDYEAYFEEFPEHKEIDFTAFSTFFFTNRHPFLDEKSIGMYKEVLRQLSDTACDTDVSILIKGFEQQEFYQELQNLIEKNTPINLLKEKLDSFEDRLQGLSNVIDEVKMDLREALKGTDRSKGLMWRNEALRLHFKGGLLKGDMGIVGAYTNTGKTSFLASELSFMGTQMKGDEYILWLNNEGEWKRILQRIYSATLNCTHADLMNYEERAIMKYTEIMNGNPDRIKVVDIQGKHVKDIERLVKKKPPSFIVFDMLDHLRGFEQYMGKEGGHIRYGHLYQWALELSTKYCPILVTSQLNREGYNCMYPDIVNMKGSGIDKQAAAVFVLMIGALSGDNETRFLSTPKFKLGQGDDWRVAVKFDGPRSRFI